MLFGNMEIKTEKKKSIAQRIESSCLQGAAQYRLHKDFRTYDF